MDWLEFIGLVGLGVAIGVYATTVGAGGGFLFAPVLLTRHAEASPAEVALASMCLVLATSGLAAARLAREKRVDYRAVGAAAAIAVPAGVLGATGTAQLPREIFAAGFAVLLTLLAAYLVLRPVGHAGQLGRGGWRRMIRDGRGETYLYWIPVRRSLTAVGLTSVLTSLAGIGGGLFFATITIRVMRMPRLAGRPRLPHHRQQHRLRRRHLPHRHPALRRSARRRAAPPGRRVDRQPDRTHRRRGGSGNRGSRDC